MDSYDIPHIDVVTIAGFNGTLDLQYNVIGIPIL